MPFEDKDPNIININGAVMAGELAFYSCFLVCQMKLQRVL